MRQSSKSKKSIFAVLEVTTDYHLFRFFHRFDDEFEQISLKMQINKKRSNQHFSRESTLKLNLEKDIANFKAGGIELPDLCDPVAFKKFKDWDGFSHNIQHLVTRFISKDYLDGLKAEKLAETQMNVE